MKTIKGPGIFLAQFLGEEAPFDTYVNLCRWASNLGYKAIQIPTWATHIFDLKKAATSDTYCDEIKGIAHQYGLKISELSTHLQGQLVAVNPAYDAMFDGFAPDEVKGNKTKRTAWAIDQLNCAAKASQRLGLVAHATFSGALLWHTLYPWPQRPEGLVEQGFEALADKWLPILNVFDECGIDVCYEIHPGEDLHDGISYEMFLEATNHHKRACILYDPSHMLLQQMDYLQFIDFYHERIKAFHVKDAEFNPTGKQGVYGGYQSWKDRAGRFRSLGDGQIDFKDIFSKLTQYGYDGWAVMEWECCLKSQEQGAIEGASFINDHIIQVTTKSFDDFAGQTTNEEQIKNILGL